MTLLLRTGLAAGVAALALVTARPHPAPPRTDPLLAADVPEDHPSPAYGGCAALVVGSLGLFARSRRR